MIRKIIFSCIMLFLVAFYNSNAQLTITLDSGPPNRICAGAFDIIRITDALNPGDLIEWRTLGGTPGVLKNKVVSAGGAFLELNGFPTTRTTTFRAFRNGDPTDFGQILIDVSGTVGPPQDAGSSGNLSLCGSVRGDAIDLLAFTGGDAGGTWTPPLFSGTNIYTVGIDTPSIYTYTFPATAPGTCGGGAAGTSSAAVVVEACPIIDTDKDGISDDIDDDDDGDGIPDVVEEALCSTTGLTETSPIVDIDFGVQVGPLPEPNATNDPNVLGHTFIANRPPIGGQYGVATSTFLDKGIGTLGTFFASTNAIGNVDADGNVNGKFLSINIKPNFIGQVIYNLQNIPVVPAKPYIFRIDLAGLCDGCPVLPIIDLEIRDAGGNLLANATSGTLGIANDDVWREVRLDFMPTTAGLVSLSVINSQRQDLNGNDLGIDNIRFSLLECDFDKDGIPNALDIDTDNDGILDSVEGVPNYADIDSDDDGITDNIEAQFTTAYIVPTGGDVDSDGLDDAYDGVGSLGLTPVDSDGDGDPDYIDLNSDDDCFDDNTEAYDGPGLDGVSNTPPTGGDTDEDGLLDVFDTVVLEPATSGTNSPNGTTPVGFPDLRTPGGVDRDWREEDINGGTLTGNQDICLGGTSTFVPSIPGGTWTSDDTSIATVDASGVVTGVLEGTATITYEACPGSTVTRGVRILGAIDPGTLSGNPEVCEGESIFLTSTVASGTWTSTNTSIATVDPASGEVTGVSVGGPIAIEYTVPSSAGCTAGVASRDITVTANPDAGLLSGNQAICVGDTTTFVPTVSGGTWRSSNNAIAVVDASTGVVRGVRGGTATIEYVVAATGPCPDGIVSRNVDVEEQPNSGVISGADRVCQARIVTFTSTVAGGVWSSSDTAVATVDASTGEITGVTLGTATISYTVSGSGICGDGVSTKDIIVDVTPDPGIISGGGAICVGNTTTFSSSEPGGMWSSSDTAIATVDPNTGVVTGVANGGVMIIYTIPSTGPSCSAGTASANLVVSLIFSDAGTLSGEQNICVSGNTTFRSTQSGGTWSSLDPAIATVDAATGVITGVSRGAGRIVYTVPGSGRTCASGVGQRDVLVEDLNERDVILSTQSGETQTCVGNTPPLKLTATISSGIWISLDETIARVNATTGELEPLAEGVVAVRYTVSRNGCDKEVEKTIDITVNNVPNPGVLTGDQMICEGDMTQFVSDGESGLWNSLDPSIATINSSTGEVTGISSGITTLEYTVAGSGACAKATARIGLTVQETPNSGMLGGDQNVCETGNVTYTTDGDTGGDWSSSDPTIATVDAITGQVIGISQGTTTINYIVDPTGECESTSTRDITVEVQDEAGELSGEQTVCLGSTTMFNFETGFSGGTWSSLDASIASVDNTGLITGIGIGTAVIEYTIASTGACGDAVTSRTVTVASPPIDPIVTDIETCLGNDPIEFRAGIASGLSANWFAADGSSIVQSNSLTYSPTVSSTGIFDFFIQSFNPTTGCESVMIPFKLTVFDAPNAGVGGEFSLCEDEELTIAMLDSFLIGADTGGVWTPPLSGAGLYTYTVLPLSTSCVADFAQVNIVSILPPSGTTVETGDRRALIITPVGGNLEYTVELEDGNIIGPQEENLFTNLPLGVHTVIVDNGCGSPDVVQFDLFGFPKFFSPNNDGVNETWNIEGVRTNDFITSIFDRYGRLLATFRPQDRGWNGTYNDLHMPADDYWYVSVRDNGEEFRGHFALLR